MAPRGPRPAATPLAPGRVKLQLTISEATHEKLRRAQNLARHTIPNGDLDAIIDRALTLLVEHLERRRFASLAFGQRQGRGAIRRQ